MDNAVDAIVMGFSMFLFIIAISASMYMLNQVSATSEVILYVADETNYFENIEITDTNVTKRVVDLETVIPTLYRYYKESFCVKICDDRGGKGQLVQIFDVNIEDKARRAASTEDLDGEAEALNLIYNNSNLPTYLFESPWIGNTDKDTKKRIDLYVRGGAGYINDTYVDYTDSSADIDSLTELNQILQTNPDTLQLEESFVEYVFSGDTISTEDGTETITGDKQESSKIIITYTLTEKV